MVQNEEPYAVITGASSGIGYETAKAFARRGSNLILAARRRERLEALRREILSESPGLDIVIHTADLAIPEEAVRLYEAVRPYCLRTWINNAGIGSYGRVGERTPEDISRLLRLDTEAVTLLSALFVRDFQTAEGAQLINVSSCGGYTIVPNAVTYCAAKFYVSAFTEGLARELKAAGASLRAKVFAPAATRTEFGRIANHVETYEYDRAFGRYHTGEQAAAYLMALYDSDSVVGLVDRESFAFRLCGPQFPYAGASRHNQKL